MSIRLLSDEVQEWAVGGAVFKYQQLDALRMSAIKTAALVPLGKTFTIDIPTLENNIIETGLIGWSGIVGKDGKEIAFDKKLVRLLPPMVRSKLTELISGTNLTEEEEKNLSA